MERSKIFLAVIIIVLEKLKNNKFFRSKQKGFFH